jgi:hypothetical protein
MENVPQFHWLFLLYLLLVAVPVMIVHSWMKKRVLTNKTAFNLLIYFLSVAGVAFLMHFIAMWLYFEFFFTTKP